MYMTNCIDNLYAEEYHHQYIDY